MHRIIAILPILVIAMSGNSCRQNDVLVPVIGDILPDSFKTRNHVQILTTSSSSIDSYNWHSETFDCIVGVDEDERINFISTSDQRFITPEGISVGMKLEEVLKTHSGELLADPGWAYFIVLPSGWNAAFTVGYTMTESKPDDTTKVAFLFKNK